ncbi:unnamed protein product [Diamesa serratosioi]
MGRKIPCPKRHFGVRDPLKQREEREDKIKDKINNPPRNFNDQEVSSKFKAFIALKASAKSGKKMNKVTTVDHDFKSTRIDLDGMQRNINEPEHKFMRRVNNFTHQRRVEADYAAKYNVDIIRNQETGEITLKKKPNDKIDELMRKRLAEAKNGKKKFDKKRDNDYDEPSAPKLTSLQKMKLKKKSRRETKDEDKELDYSEHQRDEFKFGEFVQAPPSLVVPRKALKNETVSRPGKRDLLLSTMLNVNKPTTNGAPVTFRNLDTSDRTSKKSKKGSKVLSKPIDKKGKRKNLPASTRVALESARQNAVDLYRQMKKKQPIVPIPNKNLEDF